MEKWKTLKSDYHYESAFGNLRKDTCQLPNGMIIEDFYVQEYADWVNAIVLTKDHQIVLVEQYRHPGQDFFLEIPAGKIEEGETLEEGILREVREETGFTSSTPPIKLGEFMVNPATQTNKVATFLIVDSFKGHEQELDDTEELNVRIFPFEVIEDMIRNQQITQLFSVSAYYLAKDRLRDSNLSLKNRK